MTKAQLIKELCKREGKKSQVSIGNIREIISILEDLCAEHCSDLNFNDGMLSLYSLELLDLALHGAINKKAKKIMAKKKK